MPLMNNPGLQHLAERIFLLLNPDILLNCRLVSQSWNKFLENPTFWVKKCDQKGLRKHLHNSWINLKVKLELDNDIILRKKMTLCLMKMHFLPFSDFLSPLHMASHCGDLLLVRYITENVKSSMCKDQHGSTPIHYAARMGHVEIVKVLAAFTDNPNAPDEIDWTPIDVAIDWGHTEVLKVLASLIDNPNAPDDVGMTPIYKAATQGHTEMVKYLVALTDDVNPPNIFGVNPIHAAAENGHIEIFLTEIVEFLDSLDEDNEDIPR